MRRSPRGFLWDVVDAADAITQFTQDRTLADFTTDLMLRSAVERQFEIIGEALSQLAKIDPAVAARIPELRRVVNFRNALIHGYDRVEALVVWQAISERLPPLRARAAALFAALQDPA